ncbi:MAG: cytochrome c [Gammaproteobacteria bacterium]|nr:cytochrome c [Gammaproteobacteria bacterium]MDH5312047.1 cytochrome c [Gammaproteobacteria bacterium]
MQRKIVATVVAAAITLGISIQVVAETTPEDARDYRGSVMTALRGHIGASSMILRGLVEDNGQLLNHAESLANTALELKNLFPAGSNVGESKALPAIWEQQEKFAEAIKATVDATAAFEDAVVGGDAEAIGAAFRAMGQSCRGCHDNFRQSED